MKERQEEIDRFFKEPLEWRLCENLKKSHLAKEVEGGYRDDPEEWTATQDRMIQAMVNLEKAIGPLVPDLRKVSVGHEGNGLI